VLQPHLAERPYSLAGREQMSGENIAMSVFYALILLTILWGVKATKHRSRPLILSFLFMIGVLTAALAVTSLLIYIIYATSNTPSSDPVIMGFAALILATLVQAWRWSASKLKKPLKKNQDKS
jgi:uncharacterized membrane protein YqjE